MMQRERSTGSEEERNKTAQQTSSQASCRTLVLGYMPLKADPASFLAAGPWCFAAREDFFPDWEQRFGLAPEPFSDRERQVCAMREAEALASDSIPRLAEVLQPGTALPASYWEVLLAPFAINAARLVTDVWHRIQQLIKTYGESELTVPLLSGDCPVVMEADSDITLKGALNPLFLHWLFSKLLTPVLPASWKAVPWKDESSCTDLAAKTENTPKKKSLLAKAEAKWTCWLKKICLALPVPPRQGISLSQSLRWSLALLHKSKGSDCATVLADNFSSDAAGVRSTIPFDTLELFLELMPKSLRALHHPQTIRRLRFPRTRLAIITMYEDAKYRQKLALWRAGGGRFISMQHGGNYGMMAHTCTAEFVEYSQHAFITWGWENYDGALGRESSRCRFLPLPSPRLARIRNAWMGGDPSILFVGTEIPSFAYQLDSHPTPLENLAYRSDKEKLLKALDAPIQEHILYRPYFPTPGSLDDAAWILARFPKVRLCSGDLLPRLLRCRLLLLDHHGTVLLEAMAANVPTVCFWNPVHWPLSKAFADCLPILQEAGIWHEDTESASALINAVWTDPEKWWSQPSIQKARSSFLKAFALCSGNDLEERWISALRSL